jgi:hypothetical protein
MIPAFLISRFGPKLAKVVFYGGIVFVLLLLLVGFILYEQHVGSQKEVAKQQARELKVQQQVDKANNFNADIRVEDAVRSERQTQELKDVVKNAPNPDAARIARGCLILRQQGRDTSHVAGCGGR